MNIKELINNINESEYQELFGVKKDIFEKNGALRCLVWSPSIYSGVAGGDFWCLGAVLMRWRQAFCPSP